MFAVYTMYSTCFEASYLANTYSLYIFYSESVIITYKGKKIALALFLAANCPGKTRSTLGNWLYLICAS